MKTTEYLDAIKTRHNKTSDYAIAKLLGVTTGKVSEWRSGRTLPGNLACFKIAELLGDQPAAVIADIELERAERAEKTDDADAWKGLIQKIGGGALSVLLMMGGGGISNADAKLAADRGTLKAEQSIHRIFKKRRQKVWRNRWFAGLLPLQMAC